MRSGLGAATAAAAMVALAGCGSAPSGGGGGEALPAMAPSLDLRAEGCANGILFQFVPFAATDAWLPPGFHPRDAQDFVGAPVATGQGAAVLAAVDCGQTDADAPLAMAFLALFVEPVPLPGLEPAALEFYEVQHLAEEGALTPFLDAAGWAWEPASVAVSSPEPAGQLAASVADGTGPLYAFQGPVAAPFAQGEGIRLWRDTPGGLAYVQYDFPMDPSFGAGTCALRPGSPLAELGGGDCPPADGEVATFPGLAFDASARSFPGVHL